MELWRGITLALLPLHCSRWGDCHLCGALKDRQESRGTALPLDKFLWRLKKSTLLIFPTANYPTPLTRQHPHVNESYLPVFVEVLKKELKICRWDSQVRDK